MPTHVALLRGINVGGRAAVDMAELRRVVQELGHRDVSTYLRSGNVLFSTERSDGPTMAAELERAVADGLGVAPRVVVLSRDELARAVADDPFRDEPDPKRVHAVFLTADPDAAFTGRVAAAEQRAGGRDRTAVVGRVLYLHTPDGYGRSALAEALLRLTAGEPAGTARNRSTVTALLARCDG